MPERQERRFGPKAGQGAVIGLAQVIRAVLVSVFVDEQIHDLLDVAGELVEKPVAEAAYIQREFVSSVVRAPEDHWLDHDLHADGFPQQLAGVIAREFGHSNHPGCVL